MIDISKIAATIKLAPRYLLAIAITCGIYIALGETQLHTLGLLNFDTRIRPWAAGTLIVSVSLLVAHGLAYTTTRAVRRRRQRALMRLRKRRLHDLSPGEQAVLASYILGDTKTRYLSIKSGVAGGLEADKIIYRSAIVSSAGMRFAYNIQPWAWEYLHAHPELLNPALELDDSDADTDY